MTTFDFRPAIRENTSLIIGLAGGTGSGKTMTALLLATGLAGPSGKIAFIDTERGRALHYAPAPGVPADPSKGTFAFNHAELNAPFTPDRYLAAIKAAEAAGHAVIIVDSASHEWAGEGGILDWQDDEFQKLGARDSVKMLSWTKPKRGHKKMVNRMVQCRCHLILCLRAEEKVKLVKDADGKQKVIAAAERPINERWEPICEKSFPFEMTVSFVLTPGEPGVGYPLKLQGQHRPFFPQGQKIGLESGTRLSEWAKGGAVAATLTRGEVKRLEELLAKATEAGRIDAEEADEYRLAIHEKNAKVIRDGIRQLEEALAA